MLSSEETRKIYTQQVGATYAAVIQSRGETPTAEQMFQAKVYTLSLLSLLLYDSGEARMQACFLELKHVTTLTKPHHTTQVVGWCIEWMQACFLVLDDIMDDSSET